MQMKSRTSKSVANITSAFVNKLLTLTIQFVVRTVFIYTLGKEYLGINGLFSSIISLLSLADLGFGIALPFSLYKPLAENDNKRIKMIISFYAKVYTFVGSVVFIIGLGLTPFLSYIIKEIPNIPHIELIYILFVLNSSVSYFFTYKRTLIVADQKGYIVTLLDSLFLLALAIMQLIVLLIFKNYILYLSLAIFITIFKNIYISYLCNKFYPYIKQKDNNKLDNVEIKHISKNIFALFIYRLAMVAETGTDNIIISSFIGLTSVGLYSNYLLIIDSLKNMLMLVFNSLTASIGNVVASDNNEKTYLIYKAINLLSVIIYGVSGIAIWILINPFIELWVGKNYLLDSSVVFILSINYYIFGSQNTTSTFRNAYGLFWEGRYRPIIMVLANIISSIILVRYIGLSGVFIGTILSRLLSVGIIDPYIIHKYGFKLPVKPYYVIKIKYGFIVLFIGIFTNWITSYIHIMNIWLWILKGIIVCIIPTFILIIAFWRKEEFKYIIKLVKGFKERIIPWK